MINPPMIVLADGISLIPKIGNQTQKIPPITSVKDNKVSSAAGKFLEDLSLLLQFFIIVFILREIGVLSD